MFNIYQRCVLERQLNLHILLSYRNNEYFPSNMIELVELWQSNEIGNACKLYKYCLYLLRLFWRDILIASHWCLLTILIMLITIWMLANVSKCLPKLHKPCLQFGKLFFLTYNFVILQIIQQTNHSYAHDTYLYYCKYLHRNCCGYCCF